MLFPGKSLLENILILEVDGEVNAHLKGVSTLA